MREALITLNGLARHQGQCRPVYLRVAQQGEGYYLDLGEPNQSRAVYITAGKWEIINHAPVHFLRPETLCPLPEPIRGGNLSHLWRLINVVERDRLLVLTWLLDGLRIDTPFPILELIGEQGSAKSTTQTLLRRLIDPNACDLRVAPKNVEDIFVSAHSNWLVSYENVSHLSAAIQDALCVLATGGGYAKRKLYNDTDESVIKVKRPIILNGISAAITAQDLLDRTISLETPTNLAVKALFEQVERKRPLNTDAWPRSAKGFADALRRVAPALRQIGVECRSLGKQGSHVFWEIKAAEK